MTRPAIRHAGENRAALQAQRAPSALAVESGIAAGLAPAFAERAAARDLYLTPPWGGRALWHYALPELRGAVVADPCDGLGHLSGAIADVADRVLVSDVEPWRPGVGVADFLAPGAWEGLALTALGATGVDWIVANPPYGAGRPEAFLERALELGRAGLVRRGVALLVRASWREGQARHALFERSPPAAWWHFAERLPMALARFTGSTATAYAWVVWQFGPDGRPVAPPGGHPISAAIPPGARKLLQRPGDPDAALPSPSAERQARARAELWRVAAAEDGTVLYRPARRGQARRLDRDQAVAEALRLLAPGGESDTDLAAALLAAADHARQLAGQSEEDEG